MSATEATTLINCRNAVVIDLRPATEFATGHLLAARNIDPAELQAKIGQIAKNKRLIRLCSCARPVNSRSAPAVP